MKEGLFLKAPPTKLANAPQDCWLQPGIRVMCICEGKRGRLFNHTFFTVAAPGDNTVTLADALGNFEINHEEAHSWINVCSN